MMLEGIMNAAWNAGMPGMLRGMPGMLECQYSIIAAITTVQDYKYPGNLAIWQSSNWQSGKIQAIHQRFQQALGQGEYLPDSRNIIMKYYNTRYYTRNTRNTQQKR